MLVHVDFKRRVIIPGPQDATARKLVQSESDRPLDMFEEWDRSIESLGNRFGETHPRYGVIYNQDLKSYWFDTYGRGCVHNSIHQYRGPAGRWNNPIPFPADLRAIDSFLRYSKREVIILGVKSDPFQWMDAKYQVTKHTLELANKYGKKLVLKTMSDLCAHNDYMALIKEGGHSVVFQMGFEEMRLSADLERYERLLSPGAPSILRRQAAIERLKESGIRVTEVWSSIKALPAKRRKEFERNTGTTISHWTGETK